MDIRTISVEEWAAEVPGRGTSVFHRPETLGVVERHTSGDLSVFVGYNGDRLVGMLPVSRRDHPLGTVATSPPPGLAIPHQGPMLRPASPKQRKRERLNEEFTTSVLERLDDDSPFSLLRILCDPSHTDPRPFRWAGLDVRTLFTYWLDLGDTTTDDVRSGFSRSLRREIDAADEEAITVDTEGIEGARLVFDDCASRYAEQGRSFSVEWPFVRDLVDALGDRCRAFVSRGPDGEYLGGVIVLYGDDTAHFWLGGVRHSHENVTTNSLLHWEIIRDIVENPEREDVEQYDLFGANTARICEYKAKFGGRLMPYYAVESTGAGMTLAKSAYSLADRLETVAGEMRPGTNGERVPTSD
jgi:hypothetical protein